MEEVMVEFTGGGPHDGKTLSSRENPEFDASKALWVLRLVGASLDIAQRKEDKPGALLIWRVPSPEVTERAKAEQWSEAKATYLMQYHEYHITGYEAIEGLVVLKAHYRGVKPG